MPDQKRLDQLLGRVAALQRQLNEISLTGGRDVIVAGDPRRGFKIDIIDDEAVEGGPSGGGLRGCTNPMATNYNPFATVDDGSCVFPAGDCPPDISLACDSVSASLTKCGFIDFIHLQNSHAGGPVQYYISQTDTFENTCCVCGGDDDSCQDASGSASWTYDISSCTFSGGGSAHCPDGRDFAIGTATTDCGGGATPCVPPLNGGILTSLSATFTSKSFSLGPACSVGSETLSTTASLSGEYTTSMLIDNTVAALPAYDGSFSSSNCTASRNLASDESSYAITRFEYKFTFSPVGNDFILSWNEHTEFDAGGSSNSGRSIFVSAGSSETAIFECLEPSANGTTTITDIVCTPTS